MFDRVEMNVLDVPTQIVVVADQMFPIPTLPDTAFATGDAPIATPFRHRQTTGKARFDLRPAIGIVGIASRQTPDAMQVIRQHHDRRQLEYPGRMRRTERRAKIIDPVHQQSTAAFQQIDGKEARATRHMHASIVRHASASRTHQATDIGEPRICA